MRGQTPPGYLQAIQLAMKLPIEEGGPVPLTGEAFASLRLTNLERLDTGVGQSGTSLRRSSDDRYSRGRLRAGSANCGHRPNPTHHLF